MNVLIIGATSGIGRALARLYAEAGHPVLATGRRQELLDTLREESSGIETAAIDLESPERIGELWQALERWGQRPDLVLYAAGFGEINPQLEWELCRQTLEVNVMAFTACANAFYRLLVEHGGGAFAAISSVGAVRGFENDSGYSASKMYISHYMEGLARKSFRDKAGVDVITILPGFVDTAMAKGGPFFWMCSPQEAARQIARGIRRRKRRFYVTRRWALVAFVMKRLPWFLFRKI